MVCHSSSCEIWWKQVEDRLARLRNLTVLRLPAPTAQALAALAERTMRLQCLVQDGAISLSTDAAVVEVALEPLKRVDA